MTKTVKPNEQKRNQEPQVTGTPTARLSESQLQTLCAALGWQGGTYWQVVDEIRALKAALSAQSPPNEPAPAADAGFMLALNTLHPNSHKAADAFWEYWKANGETHKHGYYESTWGAINRAIRLVGVVPREWKKP